MKIAGRVFVLSVVLLWTVLLSAQTTPAEPEAARAGTRDPGGIGPGISVPRLIKFSGAFLDQAGKAMTGVHGLTIAVYKDQQGGAPLWIETQNAEFDGQGRYTILLGATKSEGVPLELFATDEPRWLGIHMQLPGWEEAPRALLVSVPYALKAADSAMVGGLPATSFVLTPEAAQKLAGSGASSGGLRTVQAVTVLPTAAVTTANYVAFFVDGAGTVGDSTIYQSGGNVGIGTTTPGAKLQVNGPVYLDAEGSGIVVDAAGFKRMGLMKYAGLEAAFTRFSGTGLRFGRTASLDVTAGTAGNFTLEMLITGTGDVGIGTNTPGSKLDVAGNVRSNGQFISVAPIGLAPLAVSSTTKVTNLNADLLDGVDVTAFASVAHSHDVSGITNAASLGPNTFTGTQTVLTGAPASKGIVVRGAASQSANLQEWQNSGGTPVASVSVAGTLTVGGVVADGSALTNLNANPQIAALLARITYLEKADGAHLWSKRFGAASADQGNSVAVDSSGNVLVTGYFNGAVDFGGGGLASAGGNDIFVAKYSGVDGSHLWSKRFGGTGSEEGLGVAVDGSGSVLLTGYFNGTVDLGGGGLASVGSTDIFVAKYSGVDGSHLWSKRFGSTGSDVGSSVAVDSSGNVFVTGYFNAAVDFGGGGLVSVGQDMFVAKYSGVNGSHVWSKNFGAEGALSAAVDGSGNVVVTGYLYGTVDFGGGGLAGTGDPDMFVAKFSGVDGSHLWSKRFGGSVAIGYGVAVDSIGNVLVTGYFFDSINFGGGDLTGTGTPDIFVAKLSSGNGSHLWSKRILGPSTERGYSVAVDSSGNVVLTGVFAATVDFGGGGLASAGSNDIFVAKYSGGNGSHLWSQRFGGTSDDAGLGVAVDSSGNVLVTGRFNGTADFGGGALVSAGGQDLFVAKFKK